MEVYRLVIEAMRGLPEWQLRILVGPSATLAAVAALARERAGVEVWSSGTAEEAIRDATIMVSRSGYNTSYTLVQTDRPVSSFLSSSPATISRRARAVWRHCPRCGTRRARPRPSDGAGHAPAGRSRSRLANPSVPGGWGVRRGAGDRATRFPDRMKAGPQDARMPQTQLGSR